MKNVMKLLGIVILTAVIVLSMVSCKDKVDQDKEDEAKRAELERAELIGKWYKTQAAANSGKDTEEFEFRADDSFFSANTRVGTWSIKDNVIIIKVVVAELRATFSISGTKLTISERDLVFPIPLNGDYYKPQ